MRRESGSISKHISWLEATKSNTAIKRGIINLPTSMQILDMRLIAENVFEPLRAGLGNKPINIASFFRSHELNDIIGGANGSQHLCDNGAAIDLDVDGSDYLYNYQVFNYIYEHLMFDQLLWEFGDKYNPAWVHVSYKCSGNRKEALVVYEDCNGKTKYKDYV